MRTFEVTSTHGQLTDRFCLHEFWIYAVSVLNWQIIQLDGLGDSSSDDEKEDDDDDDDDDNDEANDDDAAAEEEVRFDLSFVSCRVP